MIGRVMPTRAADKPVPAAGENVVSVNARPVATLVDRQSEHPLAVGGSMEVIAV